MLSLFSGKYNTECYEALRKSIIVARDSFIASQPCNDCRNCNCRIVCDDLSRLALYLERKIHDESTKC